MNEKTSVLIKDLKRALDSGAVAGGVDVSNDYGQFYGWVTAIEGTGPDDYVIVSHHGGPNPKQTRVTGVSGDLDVLVFQSVAALVNQS